MVNREYPSDWDSRRREIYKRDDYICQNCGRQGGPRGNAELHANHIVPKSNGGTHSKSNLVSVCKQCHNAIHGDSTAPSGRQTHQTNQGGYFNSISEIVGDISRLQQKVGIYSHQMSSLVGGGSINEANHQKLETDVLELAFELKTDIVASRNLSPPSKVSDDVEFTIVEVLDLAEEIIKEVITYVEAIQGFNGSAESAVSKRSCPECGGEISDNDNFCGQCGADTSSLGQCPECGTAVDVNDSFCTDCGEELESENSENQFKEVESGAERIIELSSDLKLLMKRSSLYALRGIAAVNSVNKNKNFSAVSWEYCPNCGFQQGVWIRNGTAECVLCTASWESKGFLSKKWEMTSGEYHGEALEDDEWNEQGKVRHSNGRYEEIFEETSHDAITSRFSDFQ